MEQVYNYLASNYISRPEVRNHVLKRDDLKRIYNNIITLRKQSPLYKVNLNKDNQLYALGIKDTAIALRDKIEEISSDEDESVFRDKTVVSDNEDVLSANLLKEDTNNIPNNISITVNSLAASQRNSGVDLYQTAMGLEPGNYMFAARVKDKTYQLAYVISNKSENLAVQNDMADLLNKSVPGITAVVEKKLNSKYSRMIIESDFSGKYGELSFSLEDMKEQGIIDYLGINAVEQYASDAEFRLNEIDKRTLTNVFSVENTLQITLLNTADKPINLQIVPDAEKVFEKLIPMKDTYNSLIDLALTRIENSTEHFRAGKLINDFKNLLYSNQDELSACGINEDENGKIKIDEVLAYQAVLDGGMEDFFHRENGFIAKIKDKLDSITINPMDYLDKMIITYPNNKKDNYVSPYITSIYSGMLFNYYC